MTRLFNPREVLAYREWKEKTRDGSGRWEKKKEGGGEGRKVSSTGKVD